MAITYDTQEVRRIARELSSLSSRVTAAANGSVRRTADELPVHFRGEAADELKTSLNGMLKDVHSTASALNKLSSVLMTYAQLLDAADKGFTNLIGNK